MQKCSTFIICPIYMCISNFDSYGKQQLGAQKAFGSWKWAVNQNGEKSCSTLILDGTYIMQFHMPQMMYYTPSRKSYILLVGNNFHYLFLFNLRTNLCLRCSTVKLSVRLPLLTSCCFFWFLARASSRWFPPKV